jgi:hypothetical protein
LSSINYEEKPMTNDDLRKYAQQIISYLKSDFNAYEEARKAGVNIGAGPYLLTASSGIDFFGSLGVPDGELDAKERNGTGLKRKSTKGSKWYIKNYLTRVNSKYGNTGVANFLYTALRCGQVHEGIVNRGILIGTRHPDYHLSILEIRKSDADTTTIAGTYVNTRVLAQDFISSTDSFVEDKINHDQSASELASRLSAHLSATLDQSESIDLPRLQLDDDSLADVYDFSSYSPAYTGPRYSLKSRYWEEL